MRGETKGSIGGRTAVCGKHWLLPSNRNPLGWHTMFGFRGLMHSFQQLTFHLSFMHGFFVSPWSDLELVLPMIP